MTDSSDTKTNCLCQYTLTITNEVVRQETSSTKDNFSNVPSIHEVDEDDDSEVCVANSRCLNIEGTQTHKEHHDDNESTYSVDSFCSDDSCEEIEGTTAQSFSNNIEEEETTTKNAEEKDEEDQSQLIPNLGDNQSLYSIDSDIGYSISTDRFTPSKRGKRKNMSFTDEEMRRIERENELLLRKIMAQQKPRNKLSHDNGQHYRSIVSSSAINRKKLQRKIEGDNLLLLKKIQQAKSCVMSSNVTPGYRLTIL